MTPRRIIRTTAFVLAAGLAVVACGSSSDTAEPAAVTEPAATQPAVDGSDPAPSSAVPELLQFTSPLVGGGEIDAAALAGKPTAFWFWSPT
jgi:ABC-type glycerol-3-phosphate transport system substrate-binding protein